MLRIYDEDISDEPKVRAGSILEGVILAYCNSHGLPNTPAEVVFKKREGSHEDWEQDFEDSVFGGHLDALTPEGHIVECKTTSSPEIWMRGEIPEHYWLQASLYAKFMNTDTIHFTVAFLSPDDVANPYKFVPTSDNVHIYTVGLHPEIDSIMEQAKEWYGKYIANGVTPVPDLDSPVDSKIVRTLEIQQMDAVQIGGLMERYEALSEKVAELNEAKKELDDLKDLIAQYMKEHNLNIRTAKATYKYVESSRMIPDTDAMKKDGIYDNYVKTSISRSIKKIKS